MPIPKVVGQWNKAGLNRLTRHIAPWMPGFGVIVHHGRRSGRRVGYLFHHRHQRWGRASAVCLPWQRGLNTRRGKTAAFGCAGHLARRCPETCHAARSQRPGSAPDVPPSDGEGQGERAPSRRYARPAGRRRLLPVGYL